MKAGAVDKDKLLQVHKWTYCLVPDHESSHLATSTARKTVKTPVCSSPGDGHTPKCGSPLECICMLHICTYKLKYLEPQFMDPPDQKPEFSTYPEMERPLRAVSGARLLA